MQTEPRRFLIANHGWSGSYWLAHVLHDLPGIACVHSSAALPAAENDPYAIDAILSQGALDDVYARLGVLRAGYLDRASQPDAAPRSPRYGGPVERCGIVAR
jgi:hypothetical protein